MTDSPLELWGGVECTINRVDDKFFDQLQWSGHRTHMVADLQRFASLGMRTLRTALQWEYWDTHRDWTFFDAMLGEMQRLELKPIAGLLHHGSGPPRTDLLDAQFPEKLATYAGLVAQRYPWITSYTPVNEPHTTSRFSCLYGHWYPHEHSLPSYLRALLNEVKGTVLAMRAIRAVQPAAELVYTEDGGSISGTANVQSFQAERQARRWLGTDLLCGLVTPTHPLYRFLLQHGISEAEIDWFGANRCPPSLIGLNYYLTSDRFLDERVELYPAGFRGGDTGSEPFVDIEALRVHPRGIAGVESVLREAWERYGIPVAITEAHLGGGTEDQIRWLAEVWDDAQKARASGVEVTAVTVWALLGSYNWSNLCTRDEGRYEPGVFDVADGSRRETPLTRFIGQLATHSVPAVPAGQPISWWHQPSRLEYSAVEEEVL